MRFIDKAALTIFSVLVLIISVIACLTIFGWIDLTTMYVIAASALANNVICNIIIIINIIFILLAIKAIFFESGISKNENYNDGIMLENDDGKLIITKETLINMVDSVIKGFVSVKANQTKIILDKDNNIAVIENVEVIQDAVLKELSNNMQIKIKEVIKKSLDLEVKNVDIRIKNVVDRKEETKEEKK